MFGQRTLAAVLAATAAVGCGDAVTSESRDQPAFLGVPADGNGNKQVIPLDFEIADFATCPNGEALDIRGDGWIQVRLFTQEANPRVELDVAHVLHTWTNSAGETFVDREIGPDRYYLDAGGNLILSITGLGSAFGSIGQLVINLTTGEIVFSTGPGFPDHLEAACDALS
jgi:hypothetical protein